MRISIVTIHLDDYEGLTRTLQSISHVIAMQDVEWIFVDGGTVPGSTAENEIMTKAKAKASHYVSGPDEGIYDAMNKGTGMASGQYVLYLNAGDELHEAFDPSTIFCHVQDPGPCMLMGRCVERSVSGAEVALKTRSPAWAWYGMPGSHPAILFRRDLLGETPFDTQFRIAADYDLFCRLLRYSGLPVKRVPMYFARFYLGGLSDISHRQTLEEEHRIRVQYFPVPPVVSQGVKRFKSLMKELAKISWFRRIWRKWV